jgi:hypothetical protein
MGASSLSPESVAPISPVPIPKDGGQHFHNKLWPLGGRKAFANKIFWMVAARLNASLLT